jgi:hypothetical protein
VFDEADYNAAKDVVAPEIREKKMNVSVSLEEEEEDLDTSVCRFKNVLKNGVIIGATEGHFNHFVGI